MGVPDTSGRRCAVLGDPIAHSLSPVLHRAGYEALGLAWTYDAHRVPAGGLAHFLAGLDDAWRGLSLTMPLKRDAVRLVDQLTDRARLAGAVNTIVIGEDGERLGDNTDLPGAVSAIRERTTTPLASAAILGGGATATSIGLALIELGVGSVRLLVRDEARATETADSLRRHPRAPTVVVEPLEGGVLDTDIVVSTIPAVAQTHALVARCAQAPVVFEALYEPWPTPLVRAAQDRALVSGLDLLVHQAVLQFELFTGMPAPLDAMRTAGRDALAERMQV